MIRNTENSFGSVAKWLHWLTALWVLIAYIIIYYLHWVLGTEHDLRVPLIRAHKAVGFCVLIFFVLRIYWRITNPHPKLPSSMPKWQVKASGATHFMLYFLLIATPLSGYLGNSVGVVVGPFLVIPPPDHVAFFVWFMDLIGVTYEQFEVPFDYFHYHLAGPLLLPIILAAHVSAALYHHYVEKDDVLKRMLPTKSG
jgi:cytochrome b561